MLFRLPGLFFSVFLEILFRCMISYTDCTDHPSIFFEILFNLHLLLYSFGEYITCRSMFCQKTVLRRLRGACLRSRCPNYANISVQYTAIFHCCKNGNFQMRKCDILLILAQNIDRGYTLEPPHQWGGSNKYPRSMIWSENKKKNVYPCKPHFYYIKVGCKRVFITRICKHDANVNCWK